MSDSKFLTPTELGGSMNHCVVHAFRSAINKIKGILLDEKNACKMLRHKNGGSTPYELLIQLNEMKVNVVLYDEYFDKIIANQLMFASFKGCEDISKGIPRLKECIKYISDHKLIVSEDLSDDKLFLQIKDCKIAFCSVNANTLINLFNNKVSCSTALNHTILIIGCNDTHFFTSEDKPFDKISHSIFFKSRNWNARDVIIASLK